MTLGFTLVKQLPAIALLATSVRGVSETCCDRLATSLSTGKILQSSNANYTVENNKYWSATCVLEPTCIFVPESSSDVSTAVKILVEHNCEFGIRGGGHATNPGWAGTDSGVLISLSKLNTIEVSKDKASVVVGAGNRWGDVYEKVGEYGMTVAGGRVSIVGVSGLLLGGGLSFLMHEEGFGADNVISYEIVLADGKLTTVTKKSAKDLFKALKGGTGNFGIVTSFELRTFPINNVYAGHLYYSPEQYDALFPIMETYARQGIESDPKTHVIGMFACVPSQSIDMATFYSFYSEPVTTPPPALKPFFDVPTVVNTVKVKTVKEAVDELGEGGESKVPVRYQFRDYTIRADANLYKQLFDAWHSTAIELNSTAGLATGIVYQPISNSMIRAGDKKGGNVLGLEPADDPLVIVSYLFSWSLPEDDNKVYAAIDKMITASTDIAKSQNRLGRYIYLNYASTNQQPIQSYGPAQVNFLRKVKAKYDPNGVFERLSRGGFKIPS
ncbi:unnamed protein product [Rhizoctonia solani]|uniref:FAD-binding PCMH-type domain-containing protein n=1 Tax=Rhizoctonia solani TaxID=456999 RepID=A0A8H3ATP9_9AGAM|nr:unnamed protein product [Rhizoctonia solani]CAE6439902.1 unnamed protein product [Rhizoctonia solani]